MQKGAELQQLMQQLEMVSYMENNLSTLPKFLQMCLQGGIQRVNQLFGHGDTRRSTKKVEKHKRNNCQITGTVTNSAKALFSEPASDFIGGENVHVRLPDPLLTLVYDRYRNLE